MGSITLCHCSQVKLTEPEQAAIAQRWDGCLCHLCLLTAQVELRSRHVK